MKHLRIDLKTLRYRYCLYMDGNGLDILSKMTSQKYCPKNTESRLLYLCSFFSRRFGINDHAALINDLSRKIVNDVLITSIVL